MSAYERCDSPLELDLSNESTRRLYLVAFEAVLPDPAGARLSALQLIIERAIGTEAARYLMVHAIEDARDLCLPTTVLPD